MAYTKEQLDNIFCRTSGYCHICSKKLCRKNYAKFGSKGAWEFEHSVAQCNGGTCHGNNLYAAHITCNRNKGRLTTRTARRRNGKTCAPMSLTQRQKARTENTVIGTLGGGLLGFAIGGPIGAAIGAVTGGKFGHSLNPDKMG